MVVQMIQLVKHINVILSAGFHPLGELSRTCGSNNAWLLWSLSHLLEVEIVQNTINHIHVVLRIVFVSFSGGVVVVQSISRVTRIVVQLQIGCGSCIHRVCSLVGQFLLLLGLFLLLFHQLSCAFLTSLDGLQRESWNVSSNLEVS